MKRFINIATAAALTASMICVPTAMVAYAAETASFEVCMPDQRLESGEKSVTIPVSFDEDISFTTIDTSFGYKFTAPSNLTLSIVSVKSALPDSSGVTVTLGEKNSVKVSSSDGKDFTLKKGTVLFNITVEIGNLAKNDDGTEKWPNGTSIRFLMNKFSMMSADKTETQLSSNALIKANSILQLIPLKKTEGMSVSVGSVSASTNEVKVPVKITGSMMSFITQFKVDNRAEITDMTSSDQTKLKIEFGDAYANAVWTNSSINDVKFDNSEVIILTVKLPDDAKESDKFTLSVRRFDSASADTSLTLYPSTITNGVITYTPSAAKGSELSDVKVSTPYIVSKSTKLDLNDLELTATLTDKDGVKSTVTFTNVTDNFKVVEEETGALDRTLKLEYTGTLYTCKEPFTVSYLRGLLGDISLDGKVDTRDETSTIKEYMAQSFAESFIKSDIEKKDSLKSIVDKYSIETVTNFALALADVDGNSKVDTRDATLQVKYYSANAFEDVSWDTILKK